MFKVKMFKVKMFKVKMFKVKMFKVKMFKVKMFKVKMFTLKMFKVKMFKVKAKYFFIGCVALFVFFNEQHQSNIKKNLQDRREVMNKTRLDSLERLLKHCDLNKRF